VTRTNVASVLRTALGSAFLLAMLCAMPAPAGAGPLETARLALDPVPRPGPFLRTHEAGISAAALAVTFLADEPLHRGLSSLRDGSALDAVGEAGRFLDPLGRSKRWRLAGGIVFAGGALFGSEATARTGALLVAATTVNEALTMGIKFASGRYRPFREGHDADDFRPFDAEHTSLPSGHTSAAFAAATIIAARAEPWWAGALSYTAASLVAAERVIDSKHWTSDVVLGAVTGILSARLVLLVAGGDPQPDAPAANR